MSDGINWVRIREAVILRADRACPHCRGRGFTVERHGFRQGEELIDCDCALDSVRDGTPEAREVENGNYIILQAL